MCCNRSESSIERASVKMAQKSGWLSFKLPSQYNKGNPDRQYLKDGKTVYIEYKTATGRISPRQKVVHADFKDHGHTVHVCRSVKDTMVVLNAYA
jgi:hypothetical protein